MNFSLLKGVNKVKQQNKNILSATITLAIALLSIFLIFAVLRSNQFENEMQQSDSKTLLQTEPPPSESRQQITGLTSEEEEQIHHKMRNFSLNNPESIHTLQSLIQPYADDLLANQASVLNTLDIYNINEEDVSQHILPDYPAQYMNLSPKQFDVPLLLQKDPEWRNIKYGNEYYEPLGDAGCAILTLAMLESYFSNKIILPTDILAWSKGDYYVNNEGTSWLIFGDFAEAFDYQFMNYGGNFYEAMKGLDKGELIVASVEPGFFTDIGHILLIRGYNNGKVYVNDPNDDLTKMYSIQGIDESIFLDEGVNYWGFTK